MSITAEVPISVKERWRTAGRFADVLEAEVKSRRCPMVARVVSWFNLCRICQDLEEQMLLAGPSGDDDKQLHSALLSTAIAKWRGLAPRSRGLRHVARRRDDRERTARQGRITENHFRAVARGTESGTAGGNSCGGVRCRGLSNWRESFARNTNSKPPTPMHWPKRLIA